MSNLEKEISTYNRELLKLLAYEGKFVLIKGDDVCDIYDTYADALKTGYEKFGLGPFMVKQISQLEQMFHAHAEYPLCQL